MISNDFHVAVLQKANFRLLLLLLALGLLPLPDDLQKLLEAVEVGLPLHFLEAATNDVLGQSGAPQEAGGSSEGHLHIQLQFYLGHVFLQRPPFLYDAAARFANRG